MNKIDVLDHGYVRYLGHLGSDLEVVNDARASYAKESNKFGPKDDRLLNFLIRENHNSPFRGSVLKFEAYVPLMVARQWWKYVVSSSFREDQLGWNESSRRYITEEPTFYIPAKDEWREAPSNSKQGSGEIMDPRIGSIVTNKLESYIELGEGLYNEAIELGVCAEQARLFLPAYGMYVRFRWTASLWGVVHFLRERLEHDAQKEIQLYAQGIKELTQLHFPTVIKSLFDVDKNG